MSPEERELYFTAAAVKTGVPSRWLEDFTQQCFMCMYIKMAEKGLEEDAAAMFAVNEARRWLGQELEQEVSSNDMPLSPMLGRLLRRKRLKKRREEYARKKESAQ